MEKVLLAMSGGVDSSTAAHILLNKGYDVVGATFTLWKLNGLSNESEIQDAKEVCKSLGIPHVVFDFSGDFKRIVVDDFALQYKNGLTPSPCIVCNHAIKFGMFYDKAIELGFNTIATGHYARIVKKDDDYYLSMAEYKNKDQSYFLYAIPHDRLKNILFPLGGLDKTKVRQIAHDAGLNVASKSDSQEVCFIDGKYTDFLADYIGDNPKPGDFIDKDGNVIGQHTGIWNYTVGQRKGLGVSFGKPMFVQTIDSINNTIKLVEYDDTFCSGLVADNLNWHIDKPLNPIKAEVKIRSRAPLCPATIIPQGDTVKVMFDKPQHSIAPGQSVIFYDKEIVIGGGVINGSLN